MVALNGGQRGQPQQGSKGEFMPTVRVVWLAVVILLLLAIGFEMDYQDQLKEQKQYCSMVASGEWPDYNENYSQVCNVGEN